MKGSQAFRTIAALASDESFLICCWSIPSIVRREVMIYSFNCWVGERILQMGSYLLAGLNIQAVIGNIPPATFDAIIRMGGRSISCIWFSLPVCTVVFTAHARFCIITDFILFVTICFHGLHQHEKLGGLFLRVDWFGSMRFHHMIQGCPGFYRKRITGNMRYRPPEKGYRGFVPAPHCLTRESRRSGLPRNYQSQPAEFRLCFFSDSNALCARFIH